MNSQVMPIGRRQCWTAQMAFDFDTPERPEIGDAWLSTGGHLRGDHISLVWPIPPGSRRETLEECEAGVHPHIIINLYRRTGLWGWSASAGWRVGKYRREESPASADSYTEALEQAKAEIARALDHPGAQLCARRLLQSLRAIHPEELICIER